MPISLKPHNEETYRKVTDKLKKVNKAAVIHPTGTGKMYIALKLLEENKGKKAIYIAPSNSILHDVKKNIFEEGMTMSEFPNLKRITYQKLARMTDEEIKKLEADIIVLDEFHHCGAPEWGKGVERLFQRNEGASVLGLSATPLRYNDGLRNMADELFENNVVSEMTLEEAIESLILPEASYVSPLYGYDKELEDMQTNIDKINEEDKRNEARRLLNILTDKLDENTQNLPELFSEYMHNKSGKYIVFCRNIEDMQEKMEQAQKMFGEVNSNITVRGVSSKIKESDKILTEFEQDSEQGTLKLLYAVDMLNEGYHIKDLDGVVMMRPTFSPTIYTQQLGRALTVGGNKIPVVFDLVNNFDSCKIIEDFAERMRKHKGNERAGKSEQDKKSRLSIFDKTKEFREIAEKITELSRKKIVKLEHKIEIFERFAKTGEELVGNTIFDGYPIGQWAIQIRYNVNRMNDGKDEKGRFNPTEEQLKKLESMGILERQFDSTIDEKIDSLIEWRKKYPKVKIAPIATDKDLREYSKTDEEYSQIKKEYEKIQRYYDYVRHRKYQGQLNEEQMSRSKEGNIGGVFGFPARVEELAKKYDITKNDADYILTKYGTLDNFYEAYLEERIDGEKDAKLASTIIIDTVDFDHNPNSNFVQLCRDMRFGNAKRNTLIIFSSEKLKEELESLKERERYVIERRYGLVDDTLPRNLETIGMELNVVRSRVNQIQLKALRHLKFKAILVDFSFDYESMTDVEIEQVNAIIRDIQLQNGDLSENLEKLKSVHEEIKSIEEEKMKEDLKQRIIGSEQPPIEEIISFSYEDLLEIGIESELATQLSSEIEEYKTKIENEERLKIENLNFSKTAYKVLESAGIKSLCDLAGMTALQLRRSLHCYSESFMEIVGKMNQFGISFKTEEELEQEKKQNQEIIESNERQTNEDNEERLKIENLKLSNRAYNVLKSVGIKSLGDLASMTELHLRNVRNCGLKSFIEIVGKMNQFGISFKTEEEFEQGKNQNQEIIESNERQTNEVSEKSKLIQKLLEKQKIIEEQQAEIGKLSRQKKELKDE